MEGITALATFARKQKILSIKEASIRMKMLERRTREQSNKTLEAKKWQK